MKNVITAQVRFSFKGENYSPTTTIDLNQLMEKNGQIPDLHRLLARNNKIDTYSYLYDVMESTPVVITEAEGIACDCISKGKQLDIQAFERLWKERSITEQIQGIATDRLDINDLYHHEKIKQALMDAYKLGQKSIL